MLFVKHYTSSEKQNGCMGYCSGLDENNPHRIICLILGPSWWNCLGMVQRCGLVEGIMSLGDSFEWLSTSWLFLKIVAFSYCSSVMLACLLLHFLPWWLWTPTLWNSKPQINPFLYNFVHGVLHSNRKVIMTGTCNTIMKLKIFKPNYSKSQIICIHICAKLEVIKYCIS